MRRYAFLAVAVVALTAIAGCNSRYGAHEYCRTVSEIQCRFEYQCCNGVERYALSANYVILGATHSTEQQCNEEYSKIFCWALQPYVDGVNNQRLEWDDAKAAECLAPREEGANECDAQKYYEPADDDCDGVDDWTEGLIDDGDLCYFAPECSDYPSAYCKNEEAGDDDDDDDDDDDGGTIGDPGDGRRVTYKGECQSLPKSGDSCEDESCAEGLYCDYGEATPECKKQLDNGDSCGGNDECKEESFCDFNEADPTCKKRRKGGEPCNSDGDCLSYECDYDNDTCVDEDEDIEYDICVGPGGD